MNKYTFSNTDQGTEDPVPDLDEVSSRREVETPVNRATSRKLDVRVGDAGFEQATRPKCYDGSCLEKSLVFR